MSRETTNGRASITQLCQTFRISRQAYYAAKSGPAKPRLPRPERKGAWASAAGLEAAVVTCTEKHADWGVRKVHVSLRRAGTVASRKRVWGVMNRLGLVLPAPERREEGRAAGRWSYVEHALGRGPDDRVDAEGRPRRRGAGDRLRRPGGGRF